MSKSTNFVKKSQINLCVRGTIDEINELLGEKRPKFLTPAQTSLFDQILASGQKIKYYDIEDVLHSCKPDLCEESQIPNLAEDIEGYFNNTRQFLSDIGIDDCEE